SFAQHGIAFDCLERENEIGGNWNFGKPHSSVYRSAHLISSKRMIEYPDFPMPADWPAYPSHRLVQQYFESYARHFELYRHIQCHTSVARIDPAGAEWDVVLEGGETRRYRGIVIANG